MDEAYIVRRGGGTKLFAAIGVTYPAGSSLSCTNGSKTLKAKNTSGQWVFAVPSVGTWTVTATDGTNSKSQSVSITAEGQFESVALIYVQQIVVDGVFQPGYEMNKGTFNTAGGATLSQENGFYKAVVSYGGSVYVAIDFTDIKTLYIDCAVSNNSWAYLAVSSDIKWYDNATTNALAYKKFTGAATRQTHTLDVSSISGIQYFKFYSYVAGGCTFSLYNLRGEP